VDIATILFFSGCHIEEGRDTIPEVGDFLKPSKRRGSWASWAPTGRINGGLCILLIELDIETPKRQPNFTRRFR
jgi:hypothetical protein